MIKHAILISFLSDEELVTSIGGSDTSIFLLLNVNRVLYCTHLKIASHINYVYSCADCTVQILCAQTLYTVHVGSS